ncbi:hypothetical protein F5Y09DRAFT_272260 [Xylaria sp. FL1042]|nr:hypothetical protein F5Y09DRAFT_272260 [Xylaria sp. FL1042]
MVRRVEEGDIGLKTLYSPPKQIPIQCDIIAVHGIGAHPDDTWCKTTEQGGGTVHVNWLSNKEMLPAALPNARIMRFGAKTQWFGENVIRQNVSSVAKLLLIALDRDRKNNGSRGRPLLFIAHCFGGLVVIKALLTTANSPSRQHIFDSVSGIAFMGTPFRGAEQNGQKELVKKAYELYKDVHPGILRITDPSDEMLKGMVQEFMQKLKSVRNPPQLVCFYELEFVDVMAVVGKPTQRPKTIRVDEFSGCLDGAKSIPLQRHHYNMNKFGGPDEETYKTVEEMIVEMANGSNPSGRHG